MPQGFSFKRRELLVGVLVLASTGTIAVSVSVIGIPQSPCRNVDGVLRTFTFIGDLNGYNNSRNQGGVGPFLSARACDTVVVSLSNRDVQAHGLAVEFYAANGLEALGGDTVRLQ